ncbi:small membrane protein YmiC [Yokenella regensburgei]
MNNRCSLKYWSWMSVFSVSALLWGEIIWILAR